MADGGVLRSPRIALVDLDAVSAARVAGLVRRELTAWQVPLEVYGPPDEPRGLDEIAGAWAPAATAARYANGGDVTVLVGTAVAADGDAHLSGPILALATRTSTPAFLVADEDTLTRGLLDRVERHRHCCGGSIAGVIVTGSDPAGAAPAFSAAAGKLIVAGRLGAAAPDLGLDLRSLVLTGNEAPTLVRATREPAEPGAGGIRPRPAGSRRRGLTLMVQGTHSSAGKTFMVAGLARLLADAGYRVAPFKGQNMSNNARIVAGGEIGVAQYVQAVAARCAPDVRMNPVLLKPRRGGMDVIAAGTHRPELRTVPWRLRKPLLWPVVDAALQDLRAEYDLVLIEGAGSPAEPHLYHNDIVNMRVARAADSRVLLVADASRGGAIAHCHGTWGLLPDTDRGQLSAWVFNRFFREGNAALLRPGISELERTTGVPSLGVVPEMTQTLPAEDLYGAARDSGGEGRKIAILRYPQISNFDEFAVLDRTPGVRVCWAEKPADLLDAEIVVLPGSKHVAADLDWLRARELDRAIAGFAASGGRLLGICGGLQMLGGAIRDPHRVEGDAAGLGLLPVETTFHRDKVQRHTEVEISGLSGAWSVLNGLRVPGYEIRHGATRPTGADVDRGDRPGLVFGHGNVLGVYLHGLFEHPDAMGAVLEMPVDAWQQVDRILDDISDHLRSHLDGRLLDRLLS
ncbi:cobyric acid synthase [Symbioplanes lichenis]|uniref:cobyric acid synthase n=1 Tax=Symbioplanes lichenis TaxID=1629072 RepID=UPI00273935ED|nr:cobyric acid synthase [Actinoplanes lichenis]